MVVRLLLVNPNTTATMTAAIAASASAVARPGTVVEALNPIDGPPSIENDDDERRCVPGLLEVLTAAAPAADGRRPDAYVVACFGDPGLDEARAMLDAPVLGIAQAAMHAASLAAGSFSVVTSMSATISRAWQLAKAYTPDHCLGVYACDIPVLRSTPTPPASTRSAISAPPHSSRTAAARSCWDARRWRRSLRLLPVARRSGDRRRRRRHASR